MHESASLVEKASSFLFGREVSLLVSENNCSLTCRIPDKILASMMVLMQGLKLLGGSDSEEWMYVDVHF